MNIILKSQPRQVRGRWCFVKREARLEHFAQRYDLHIKCSNARTSVPYRWVTPQRFLHYVLASIRMWFFDARPVACAHFLRYYAYSKSEYAVHLRTSMAHCKRQCKPCIACPIAYQVQYRRLWCTASEDTSKSLHLRVVCLDACQLPDKYYQYSFPFEDCLLAFHNVHRIRNLSYAPLTVLQYVVDEGHS